jgi:type II secretory pathway pseudopilin PulG
MKLGQSIRALTGQPRFQTRHLGMGFSILELVAGLVILGVVAFGASQYLSRLSGYRRNVEQRAVRDSIANRMSGYLNDRRVIEDSSNQPGNEVLKSCVFQGFGDCTVIPADQQVGFDAYIVRGGKPVRIGGGPNNPVNYDLYGKPNCVNGKKGCPTWEVRTSYWTACGYVTAPTTGAEVAATTCEQASNLFVRYQVVQSRPLLVGGGRKLKLSPKPANPKFQQNPTAFAIVHRLRDDANSTSECDDPNEIPYRVSGSGLLKCACKPGFVRIIPGDDTSGCVNQQPLVCAADEVVTAISIDGVPVCTKIEMQCNNVNFGPEDSQGNQTDAVSCDGGWLESITFGACTTGTNSKKGSSQEVSCATNSGSCCVYELKP